MQENEQARRSVTYKKDTGIAAPTDRLAQNRAHAAAAAVSAPQKDPYLQQVEDILAENLADEYRQLTETRRVAFRAAGEEAAAAIYALATAGRATLHGVLRVIERWLSLIVTKQGYWWVKQESYIKARKILLIHIGD